MNKVTDLLSFMAKHDVKFIKVSIIDILGQKRSVEFPSTSFSDIRMNNIMCDSSSILGGSETSDSDKQILLDESSASLSKEGVLEIFGSLIEDDGSYLKTDSRAILSKQIEVLSNRGYILNVGLEPEFYFLDKETLDPIDDETYFEILSEDKSSYIRKKCVKALLKEGYIIGPFHHEVGPGQNEINFAYSEALVAADKLYRYKEIIKDIASKEGVIATFYPKPFEDLPGSGMHLNCSLSNFRKENLFYDKNDNHLSELGKRFVEGLCYHAKALSALACTISNSYNRLHSGLEAPSGIYWSYKDRNAAIRIPRATKEKTRIELRFVDNTAQIYLLLAAIISAGLDGIDHPLRNSTNDTVDILPKSLEEALNYLKEDEVITTSLSTKTVEIYINEVKKDKNLSQRKSFMRF